MTGELLFTDTIEFRSLE